MHRGVFQSVYCSVQTCSALDSSACRWAVGDCNDVKEVKQGYLALEQGKVMGKNLKTLLEKGDAENLVAYKPFNGMDVSQRT